jgi:hypothetical protein
VPLPSNVIFMMEKYQPQVRIHASMYCLELPFNALVNFHEDQDQGQISIEAKLGFGPACPKQIF